MPHPKTTSAISFRSSHLDLLPLLEIYQENFKLCYEIIAAKKVSGTIYRKKQAMFCDKEETALNV